MIGVSMTHAPHPVHAHRVHVDWWLATVVALAAALVGLGAWVIVDQFTGAERDATALIDDMYATVSAPAPTREGLAAVYTSDAVIYNSDGVAIAIGIDQIMAVIPDGTQIERVSPVVVDGDLATTLSTMRGVENPLVTTYLMRDGKIARQWGLELSGFTAATRG